MSFKLKMIAIMVLFTTFSGNLISKENKVSENEKRIRDIWEEITPYAIPLPAQLELIVEGGDFSIEAVHSHDGMRHAVTVTEGISKLSDSKIKTMLAHELGHVVLRKFTKDKSGLEAYQEEFEAHLYGAEMFARMGIDATEYIKNLSNIFNKYGNMPKNDPLRKIPETLLERVQYINAMPLVYQIVENRINNSDFDEAKRVLEQAHKNLGYLTLPPFDQHLFAIIDYLSLRTSPKEWQKVKDTVEKYKEYFNGHLLLSRSLIIPSKPIKGRFRSSSSSAIPDERPQALKDALTYYKNAIQIAPYWIEARINYLYAADLSVNIYRNNEEKDFAMKNAAEIQKAIPSLERHVLVEAYNSLAVWYAGLALQDPKLYAKAMEMLIKAEKALGCINSQAPNAWQICYNGNILSQTSKIKTTVFNKEKSDKAIASAKGASRLAFEMQRKSLRMKTPVVGKGESLPPGVSQELRGFFGGSNRSLEVVEKYLKENRPERGLTVLENGGVVIYRDRFDNVSLGFSVEVSENMEPMIEKKIKEAEPVTPYIFPEKKEKPRPRVRFRGFRFQGYGPNSGGISIEFSFGR